MGTMSPQSSFEQINTNTPGGKSEKLDKDSYFCDRELFLSLVFDAKATEWFSTRNLTSGQDTKKEFQQRFGITISFVATHSGLTRWQDFPGMEENKAKPHFSELHNRAIDEIWYRRAVEQHYVDEESFVYSVPFADEDEGYSNDTLVTASHAIFFQDKHKGVTHPDNKSNKYPVAVVGFQLKHTSLHSLFKNITSTCESCSKTCASEELECYVLDNNGFIVVSENLRDTGKFFGELQGNVMETLVEEGLYKPIRIYDYQAVCFREEGSKNRGPLLLTPLNHLKWIAEWMIGNLLWLIVEINLNFLWNLNWASASDDDLQYPDGFDIGTDPTFVEDDEMGMRATDPPYEKLQINRTRPEPCDMERTLYQLQSFNSKDNPYQANAKSCDRPFVVQKISYSNLLLVVVDSLCIPNQKILSVSPTEVKYNETLACFKVKNYELPRIRPKLCINRHESEKEIELCGESWRLEGTVLPLLLCWVAALLLH